MIGKSRPVWDPLLHSAVPVGDVWTDTEEGAFAQLPHRHQYLKVYRKFEHWLAGIPQVQFTDDSSCSQELLQLALKDFTILNKKQKHRLMLFFVEHTVA